jgi:hypothetical protein
MSEAGGLTRILPPGIAKQIILFMLVVILVTIILLAFEW